MSNKTIQRRRVVEVGPTPQTLLNEALEALERDGHPEDEPDEPVSVFDEDLNDK